MPRRNKRSLQREVLARMAHDEHVSRLRDGVRQRSQSFRPGKGKGAYSRKGKYPQQQWED